MQPIPSAAAAGAATVTKIHDISVRRVKYFVAQSGGGGADPLG
jgi:hypothetical protein